MLPSEIIPRHEQGLHSRVVKQALGMAVRKPGEPPQAHPHREVKSFVMHGAYPVVLWHTENGQLFYVNYRGRTELGDFLSAGVLSYRLGAIDLHPKRRRDETASMVLASIGGNFDMAIDAEGLSVELRFVTMIIDD